MFLKQSTASQEVLIGPFVDDTDYVTAETGLTINNTDIKLRKGGTTTHANKNSGGATHLANGRYHLTLDATDTNTLGLLDIDVKVAGALLVTERFYVLSAAAYDALDDTGSGLIADVWSWRGGAIPVQSVTGVPEVDVTYVNGSAATDQAGVLDVNVAQISADATAANNLEADYDGTGYNKSASTIGTATNVTNQVTADMTAISGDTPAANNLEAFFDGTGYNAANSTIGTTTTNTDMVSEPPTTTAIADAVWDEALSGHVAAGSAGKAVADIETDATAILADTGTDGVVIAAGQTVATVTTVTNQVTADVTAISGDTVAANNLEADYDGTGYNKSASTIGTATSVTNQVTADMTAISGDTVAANNLEAAFDGTGYDDGGVNRIGANLKEVNETAVTDTTAGRLDVNAEAVNDVTAAAAGLANAYQGLDHQVNVASATASTVVFDDAALIGTDDYYNGMIVQVYSGTGAGQSRLITDYVGGTKTAHVFPDWGTNPDATSDIIIVPGPGIGADMDEADVSGMYGATRNLPEVLNLLAVLMRNELNVDSNSIDVRNDADSANLFAYTISDDGSTFVSSEGA
jgi:hypothetical protein